MFLDAGKKRNLAMASLVLLGLGAMSWTKSMVSGILSTTITSGIDVATVVGAVAVWMAFGMYNRQF